MKILLVMEWIAAVMIMSGVVLGLGKVAVDHIVSMAPGSEVCAAVVIKKPSRADMELYLAQSERSYDLIAARIAEDIKAGGGK